MQTVFQDIGHYGFSTRYTMKTMQNADFLPDIVTIDR